MIKLYINTIIFLVYSIIMFFIGMYLKLMGIQVILEWTFFYLNSMDFSFFLVIDYVSMLFISVVVMITSMVMLYSVEYMNNEINVSRYMYLLILFMISMIFMILSPSVLSILLGWDGLGLISYCLVIYYQNSSSYNSGMITILCNRIGDVGLIMMICLSSMFGSFNMMLYEFFFLMMMMLLFAGITKSAQIPFSFWLPMAMAAPTPVSSLVHSSTLVTAGVYLMIRYNQMLIFTGVNSILLFLASFTMFISGLIANFEYDLKKIIALSTLSQLGLMMSILSLSFWDLSFFHLLTHAMFKSLLFLCAGGVIHCFMNQQDIRFYGGIGSVLPYLGLSFFVASLSLCGFPFLSGFYSKDLIMEVMFMSKMNFISISLLILSTVLTVSYSVRLMMFMFFGKLNFLSLNMIEENSLMNISTFLLLFFSIIKGSMLGWLIFYSKDIFLSVSMKLLVMILCICGVWLGMFFYGLKFYNWMIFMNTMMFMNNFYKLSYMHLFMMSESIMDDFEKGWIFVINDLSNRILIKKIFKESIKPQSLFNTFFLMLIMYMICMFYCMLN